MISKLVVHGKDREEAIARMKRAISEYEIKGIKNTLNFGMFVMNHDAFVSGHFDTHFVPEHFKPEYLIQHFEDEMEIAALLAENIHLHSQKKQESSGKAENKTSNWQRNRVSF